MRAPPRKLSVADAGAVDLILDHASAADGGVTKMAASVSQKRVVAVERLLHLLDALPATDPPSDLVERTLRRVARSGGGSVLGSALLSGHSDASETKRVRRK